VFFLNFPYLTPNIISIFYINYFKSLFPNWLVFPVLSFVFLTILYMSRNSWRLLFGCLVLFSACTSAYTYNADLSLLSEMYHSQNQVGDYLNQVTNESTVVLFDISTMMG
jgi:glucan phosphoethanolaminetransferase (alkaline phosphatase superfamily)